MQLRNGIRGIFFISFLAMSIFATAQDRQRRSPEERAQNQVRWMQKNLALTPEQNDKAYNIILRHAKELDDANRNMPAGRDKKLEKKDIAMERQDELKSVLNPDQYRRYEEHMREMKERQREKRAARMGSEF